MKKLIAIICLLLLIAGVYYFTPVKKYINDTFYIYSMRFITNCNPGELKGIPIISYHSVSDRAVGEKDMTISPKSFDEQMRYLYDSGFTPITFSQLNKVSETNKPVLITFDDGYEDNYEYAYPILKKYNFHATLFLISSVVGEENYLKINQIREMSNLIDFESHTASHRSLATVSPSEAENEAKKSKAYLETLLNKDIVAIAYPYGAYRRNTIPLIKKYYKYGLTFGYGNAFSRSGLHEIKRVPVYNNIDIRSFSAIIN